MGPWDARRRIRLPGLSHGADREALERRLQGLDGVRSVKVSDAGRQVSVVYDRTRLDYGQIETALERAGFPAAKSLWSRMKAGWFRYLDTTARENARAPAPPCCSNPRGLGGRGSSGPRRPR